MYLIKISFSAITHDTPLTVDLIDQWLDPLYPKMLEIFRKNISNDILDPDLISDFENLNFYMVCDSAEKRQSFGLEIQPWINDATLLLQNNNISVNVELLETEDHLSLGQIETIYPE